MTSELPTPEPRAKGPNAQRNGPLHGIQVLDLTTVVMGPAATQILGDLGADVIKVESPQGDSLRRIGPFRNPGMGPMFLQANRNKRSIVLDLKQVEDRHTLMELAARADVLVSNIRPQAMERLGLGPQSLASSHPRLIVASAVGFESGGTASGKAVYDDLIQAVSGVAGLFQAIDGQPRYAPINVADRVVGLHLVIAILAGLQHRQATGEGQFIEIPMAETMAQFVLADHMGGGAFVPPIGPMGYQRLHSRFRGPYPTSDGYIAIVVYTDDHWRKFASMVGQPDLLEQDARFATQDARTRHADHMGRFLQQVMRGESTAHWMRLLEQADIPCAPVNRLEDLSNDPQFQEVALFEEIDHPSEGRLKSTRFPIRFSQSPATVRRLAPKLGEHSDEIRRELQKARASKDSNSSPHHDPK
jgi:crotonobetainyl-CoA:carnitine CoA-transferase CaiB-like acyl-CoA transferase